MMFAICLMIDDKIWIIIVICMKKISNTELDIRDKRRSLQFLDVKVTMDNRLANEPPIEELVEKIDISKCLSDNYDSIIFCKLLSILYLNYNIPTDSNLALNLDR